MKDQGAMLGITGMFCAVIGFATGWMARGWSSLPYTTAEMIEIIKARAPS
jgi:hypothetical protein